MADGLFLMQRYLGSDEENSDELSNDLPSSNLFGERKEDSDKDLGKNNDIPIVEDLSTVHNLDGKGEYSNKVKPESQTKKRKRSDTELIDVNKQDIYETTNFDISVADEIDRNSDIIKSPTSLPKKKRKKKNVESSSENSKFGNLEKENKLYEDNNDSIVFNKTEHDTEHFITIGQVTNKNTEKIKPILPKWLSNPTVIGIDLREEEIPISGLSYLDNTSKKNLENAGIRFLFPVQKTVIPWLMQSDQHSLSVRPSDLCVSAPTGSGKTLAFVLPIIQSLKNRVVCAIRAVVVLPVGELAFQVYRVFETFIRGTDLKVVLLTGQKSFAAEQNALVRSGVRKNLSLTDIVVTTPSRILDHIYRTDGFCLQHLRYLVVDEADRMMNEIQQGWLKQIEDTVYKNCDSSSCVCFSLCSKRLPSVASSACSIGYISQPLQKLLYSATLSHDPEKLHALSLYRPKLFTARVESDEWIGKCPIPNDLTVQSIICKDGTKPIVLCHYIREKEFKKVLCFTESVERAQRLHFVLAEMGFIQVREISSNYRPVQRKIILEQFNSGKIQLLVCSDMVARGMDIDGVDCVISYDVPLFLKAYVHRIGRTARAGNKGTAITLLTEGEVSNFKKMLKSAEIPKPEEISINFQDLEMYVEPFKNALVIADANIKTLKASKMQLNKRTKKKKEKDVQPKMQDTFQLPKEE